MVFDEISCYFFIFLEKILIGFSFVLSCLSKFEMGDVVLFNVKMFGFAFDFDVGILH